MISTVLKKSVVTLGVVTHGVASIDKEITLAAGRDALGV